MKKKKCKKWLGFSILVLFMFLPACDGFSGEVNNNQPPTEDNNQNGTAPTDTSLPPLIEDTPTNTPDVGIIAPPTTIPDTPTRTPDIGSPPAPPPPLSTNTPEKTSPPPPSSSITPDIPTPPPPGDPSIVVTPYNINPGGTLQIILEDFGSRENVTIEIHFGIYFDNLQNTFVVTVNSDGDLTFDWVVPDYYTLGNYSILATGQTYSKSIDGYFKVQ